MLGKPPESLNKKMALKLATHLVKIETILSHQKEFMMGDQYTAIDACMTSLLHRVDEMRFTKLLRNNSLPYLRNYWKALMSRRSYQEGILDYVTGEWEPEIQSLFGDGPNKYEELALTEINRIIREK
jgi:glutathione S-transferase